VICFGHRPTFAEVVAPHVRLYTEEAGDDERTILLRSEARSELSISE